MTNKDIMRIALQQSAYDCNCRPWVCFMAEYFLPDPDRQGVYFCE